MAANWTLVRSPQSWDRLLDPRRPQCNVQYVERGCRKGVYTVDTPAIFLGGVGHRVENGRGLTKVAVVLLNGLI